MSKKISVLLALLMITAVALTGCGGAASTPAPAPSAAPASDADPAAPEKIDYPTKTVEAVYHSGVGSSGDVMLRAMDQALVNAAAAGKTKHVGWVINNMKGGSGAVAWEYVRDADPDGYTLLGFSSTFLTAPLLNEMDVSYKDLTPIVCLLIDPQVIAVPADSPYQTLDDLVADAKANPGKQSWASGVAGSVAYVGAQQIEKAYGIDINPVPFESGADASATLMGGHITAAISEFAEVREAAEGGLVRVLAAYNPLTVKGFEDIPTLEELGHPEVNCVKLRGLMGPKGMDQAVVDAIVEQVKVMLEEPSFKEYVEANGLLVDMQVGDEAMKLFDEQNALLEAAIKGE